jgi:hypothetical protein
VNTYLVTPWQPRLGTPALTIEPVAVAMRDEELEPEPLGLDLGPEGTGMLASVDYPPDVPRALPALARSAMLQPEDAHVLQNRP